jgi:hypothetical protein
MAKPTTVSVKILDSDGEYCSSSFNLGSSIDTLASIEAAAKAVVEDLQACITGQVTEVKFSKPLDISTWTLAPSDGDDTDKLVGGRFIFITDDAIPSTFNLPTFDLAKVVASSKNIDQTDADVTAFLAACLGTTLTTNQDKELTSLSKAYETYGGRQ